MEKKSTRNSSAKKWTLLLLILLLLVVVIANTYTRYTSTSSGTGTTQVAKWAVKINTIDIVNTDTFTVTFNEVTNNNVVDGKIAPESSLYAEFIVDPTGSEVAVDYLFKLGDITASAGDVPTGIAVEKVCYVDNNGDEGTTITKNANDEYVGDTIALTSQSSALTSASAKKIRVYIKWTDSNESTSNTNHTLAGNLAPTLSIQVTCTAKQHIS